MPFGLVAGCHVNPTPHTSPCFSTRSTEAESFWVGNVVFDNFASMSPENMYSLSGGEQQSMQDVSYDFPSNKSSLGLGYMGAEVEHLDFSSSSSLGLLEDFSVSNSAAMGVDDMGSGWTGLAKLHDSIQLSDDIYNVHDNLPSSDLASAESTTDLDTLGLFASSLPPLPFELPNFNFTDQNIPSANPGAYTRDLPQDNGASSTAPLLSPGSAPATQP
ncbi:hypothetical protein EG329_013651 [Mollisiaceae sp. DMI_Dod_QoI]|nr:hypothetical protein EG329_013651 [Helotiales sp. DMI_Dod_QoI]